jgi:hypothetical protein
VVSLLGSPDTSRITGHGNKENSSPTMSSLLMISPSKQNLLFMYFMTETQGLFAPGTTANTMVPRGKENLHQT